MEHEQSARVDAPMTSVSFQGSSASQNDTGILGTQVLIGRVLVTSYIPTIVGSI